MSHETKIENRVVKPVFSDARGDIFDIVEEKVGHIGMVTFKKGAVRGNHYHKESTQYSYVLEGELTLVLSDPDGSNPQEVHLVPDMLSVIPPLTVHTYTALTDARMLDITTLSRTDDGYEMDTVKLGDRDKAQQ